MSIQAVANAEGMTVVQVPRVQPIGGLGPKQRLWIDQLLEARFPGIGRVRVEEKR